MPMKSVKNENFEKQTKNSFFSHVQGSLKPKIKFLYQKVCPVARSHTHTDRVTNEGTLSGFQDRPNMELGSLSQCNFGIGIFFFRYTWRRVILLSTGNLTPVISPCIRYCIFYTIVFLLHQCILNILHNCFSFMLLYS